METIFTKEYVETILKPFEGKKLRMRTQSEDKSFSIPFALETDMEATFQIAICNMGIKFLLKDNFYIKQDLDKVFKEAVHKQGFYASTLDKLLKEESKDDCVVFRQLVTFMQENFNPQIAFTYYNMITSLKVDNNRFVMNGIEFVVYK